MATRKVPEPAVPVAVCLDAAEVAELHTLARLFELDQFGDHVAPFAVAVRVAAIAGGPVEDFTGPHDQQMPFELWWGHTMVQARTGSFADRLVEAVDYYRRESPSWWKTKATRG